LLQTRESRAPLHRGLKTRAACGLGRSPVFGDGSLSWRTSCWTRSRRPGWCYA
jgi:hypothetical protein